MLPNLPKKNKRKEADFGLIFRNMLDTEYPTASYELKDTDGKDYLNFNELNTEQINHALRNKSKKGNLIRIVSGTLGAPDYIYLKKCQYSFVVIRYPKIIVFIDIDDFIKEKNVSKRKSLTSERAKAISTTCVIK